MILGLETCATLADVLALRSAAQPGKHAYTFLKDGEIPQASLTYGTLETQARGVAESLHGVAAPGERALLLYPPGLDFIVALLGCWFAGIVAVPAYPPQRNRGKSRFDSIVADAQPAVALTTAEALDDVRLEAARSTSPCPWVATDQLAATRPGGGWQPPAARGDGLALLQYTSGSTASPKGVMVSHDNLLANERMIRTAMGHTAESTFVSWLPMYHDMGLIGNLLQPLFLGAPCYLMSPVAFLQEPYRWLKAISTYRAHTSGAPNFAYELCTRKVTPEQLSTLDLRPWQVAYNGSEPVRAATLDRFAARFSACGFRRQALYPCYGLAEATLLVSGGVKTDPPVVNAFDGDSLKNARVDATPSDHPRAQRLVGVGHSVEGQDLAIVRPHGTVRCSPGEVGEIWVRGPHVAMGYWNNPEGSASTFGARLDGEPDTSYLRTGDLGFISDGELFVAGRLKDLIIVRGQNHHPQDIEQTVEGSHAALRTDGAAAFSIDATGDERLVIVAEVERQYLRRLDVGEAVAAICESVAAGHELAVEAIVLIKPGALPRTSSGKRQRHICRAQFLSDAIDAIGEWRATAAPGRDESLSSPQVPADSATLTDWLVSHVAFRFNASRASIDVREPLARYGLDSLAAVELCHGIESSLGVVVSVADILSGWSITDIVADIEARAAAVTGQRAPGQDSFNETLSHGERALWFVQQAAPDSAAYNIARALRIRGSLDIPALRQAFQTAVDRHAILRTNFVETEQGPVRRIHSQRHLSFDEADATTSDQARLGRELATAANRPFRLEHDALLRVSVFRRSADEHIVLLSVHHIVADLWSLALLVREVGDAYAALQNGETPAVGHGIDYRHFVQWQSDRLTGPEFDRLHEFWRQHLEGGAPPLTLPFDRPASALSSDAGARVPFHLDPALTASLKRCCDAHGVTMYVAVLAALRALIYRYTRQDDAVIGTVMNGRTSADLAGIVGYLVNTVALRLTISGDDTFAELLQRTRRDVLDAVRHQDYPFAMATDLMCGSGDARRPRPVQVMLAFQASPLADDALTRLALGEAGASLNLGGLAVESLPLDQRWAPFELTLTLGEVSGAIRGTADFSTDLFERATIERLLGHFRILLETVVADPSQAIDDLVLITDAERPGTTSLAAARAAAPSGAPEATIQGRFESVVRRTPDAIAVSAGDRRLTYDALNRRANRLAHHLRRRGVGPEVPVAIGAEPSLDLVVGVLAILKAGGIYVPLDPSNPPERLALILNDVGAPVLVADDTVVDRVLLRRSQIVRLADPAIEREADDAPPTLNHPDNAAYVIYTSGSTGAPKGSIVTHRNVLRLFDQTQPWFEFGERDVWTLFHSYAFDFSVWELWGALFYGGRLVVIPSSTKRSPETFHELLVNERVTVLNQTPSAFYQLDGADEAAGGNRLALRLVIFGGEALNLERLRGWFARHGDRTPRLVNMYGITETTVHVTYRPVTLEDAANASGSLIGQPIPDLLTLLLDRNMTPVPAGVPGELYVAGPGLARGYLHRAGLTAERFVPHPFSSVPGDRLYRTGDLARRRADGDVEYLGRIDDQIKIRGFRIELGEIQTALCQHPDVRDAVVTASADESDTRQLAAYVVPRRTRAPDVSAIVHFLRARLPGYMVPSAFAFLERLPLTANGKLDRKRLPAATHTRGDAAPAIEPRSETEQILADIWRQVLSTTRIGVHDNFFDLGGDSIRSVQVVSRAKARGLAISVHQVFSHQTIASLAAQVTAASPSDTGAVRVRPFQLIADADRQRLPPDVVDAYPLAVLQAGLVYHSEVRPDYQVYLSSVHVRAPFDVALLADAIRQLAIRHAFFRTSIDATGFTEPIQLVHETADVPLHAVDLRHLNAAEQEALLAEWSEVEKRHRFEWARAPLARFYAHRRTDATFQLTLCEPLLDGWSVANTIADLLRYYAAAVEGTSRPAVPPQMSFADFVALERSSLRDPACQQFWTKKLGDCARTTITPPAEAVRGDMLPVVRLRVPLADDVSAALQRVARTLAVPLKTVLLAAHMRVLSVLSGQTDVVTGLVANGRPEEGDADTVVGLFLNTLPFRQMLEGGAWSDLVRETWRTEQQLLPYRTYPLAQLQKEHGGQPLFEAVFNFTHFHALEQLEDAAVKILSASASDQTYFPLTAQFNVDWRSARLTLDLDCSTDAFGVEEMERIGGYYQRALAALGAAPEARYELTPLWAPAEAAVVAAANATARAVDDPGGVHQLVAAQAARTPAAAAVVWGTQTWDYATLLARAAQVAAALREAGLGPETVVGLCAERGPALVAAVLGVWQAGAAYVPLDPAAPPARIAFQVADAGARRVLTSRTVAARLAPATPGVAWVPLDDPRILAQPTTGPAAHVPGTQLAYVIYTSGSTGQPKGVALEHRQLRNLLAWAATVYPAADRAAVLAGTSLCFDLSLFELWVPLTTGGTVVLAEDALQLATLPARATVRLINTVPTALAALVAQDALPPGVRTVNVAGEPLRPALVAALLAQHPAVRVLDLYGPTETTTYVTGGARTATGPETIGRPLANTTIHVLDAHQQPVPLGVVGEVYVGGAGVARGYRGRPALTAAQFVPDPWSAQPGARLYRTGDLARWRADGQLVFVGRRDGQVKLRGYRIELGEIDAALAACAGVREAATVVRDRGPRGPQLLAYVAGAPALDPQALRAHLAQRLPAYMLPADIVPLDALPRTATGKLDRRALPEPGERIVDTPRLPPQNDVETILARIWEEILGVRAVDRSDNFFDLGGDSIISLQIVARANQAGIHLTHRQIFHHQTIASLAEVAERRDVRRTEQGPVTGGAPLTPIQHWLLERHLPNPHHWNQAVFLEAREPIDPAILRTVVDRLLRHHDALRLRFLRAGAGWRQVHAPAGGDIPFERIDLSRVPVDEQTARMEATAAAIQAALDITDGPLIRVVLFDGHAAGPSHILIVVHHLAIDGISWRILLEDMGLTYRGLADGGDAQLPAKTSSFKDWAHALMEYASTETLRRELSVWLSTAQANARTLPVDYYETGLHANTEGSVRVLSITLTPDETRDLLQSVPAAYRTQINDVLLAALARTLARWTGDDRFVVDVEGHGREPIADGLDLSRTVGWFTSIFPVMLQCEPHSRVPDLLKTTKERLRQIPRHGMGFGVLHYLSDDPAADTLRALPARQLSFNYLGQFQHVLPASIFRLSTLSTGPTHDPAGERRYLLDIRAAVYDDGLRIDWSYSENVHRSDTIDRLAAWFVESLREIIAHCCSADAGGCTPSDFPLARLDQRELDRLVGQGKETDDIYPVAPIQAGMLFHAVTAADAAPYCMQVSCTLTGTLDSGAFERAWQQAIRRHSALRTAFPGAAAGDGLQVVHRDARFDIQIEDLRPVPDTERALRLQAFLDEDRLRAFDLAVPPLFRLTLFHTGDQRHECVWTYHHLILDGWSASLILKDVLAAYGAFCAGEQVRPAAVRPYAGYIAWLQERDIDGAERFWRHALEGFIRPPSIELSAAPGDAAVVSGVGTGYDQQQLVLSAPDTRALENAARQQRLTVSTLIQGAWAVMLSHYTGKPDVLFGTTVTGRPPELAHVESMIGVFINTLPVRVHLPPEQRLDTWLASLQEQQAARAPHEHAALTRIQRWSGLSDGATLFESFVVFENFPAAFSLHQQHHGLAISDVRFRIDEHYPLVVVVDPGPPLAIQIKYDCARFDETSVAVALQGLDRVIREFAASDGHATLRVIEQMLTRFLDDERLRTSRARQLANVRKLQELRGRASSVSLGPSGG